MRLIDAINQRGQPFEIPDASRDDLPQFFLDLEFKVGAEVGVKEGEFSEVLCKAGLKLYGIDPWIVYPDYPEPGTQQDQDEAMQKALDRLKGYDFTPIKKTSMGAVKNFEDDSLDFVYIDGNHSFKFVAEDIFEWSKKVKKGGVISGHDYVYMQDRKKQIHTKYVVDAYIRAFAIPNWYVIGSHVAIPGEKRDRWRSWFWVKV